MGRLINKTVLITGAARGIGKSIAEVFHRKGAYVILSDIRKEEGLLTAQSLGERSEYVHLDVRSESDWLDVTDDIMSRFGSLDVLVNNAGITGFLETPGPFDAENVNLESWNEVHAVNLTGVMLGCKYGIKMMKHTPQAPKTPKTLEGGGGGSIVNISSRSGIVGIPGAVAYASSKAAPKALGVGSCIGRWGAKREND